VHHPGPLPLDALLDAVHELRGRISSEDSEILDEAVETLEIEPAPPRGVVRRALATTAGIAALSGPAGAPVLTAVRDVRSTLTRN
jgi:hypothetical protein